MFEETLYQSTAKGVPFVKILKDSGIVPGIKVDTGLQVLPGTDGGRTHMTVCWQRGLFCLRTALTLHHSLVSWPALVLALLPSPHAPNVSRRSVPLPALIIRYH
jgi:hypothetical protein